MHPHHSHVLQLDIQGTPQAWISLEHAALHVATGSVAWVDGDGPLATLRGGFNVERGRQSLIDVHPIIALHGAAAHAAAVAGVAEWHLSLTHTDALAQAVAVAVGQPGGAAR